MSVTGKAALGLAALALAGGAGLAAASPAGAATTACGDPCMTLFDQDFGQRVRDRRGRRYPGHRGARQAVRHGGFAGRGLGTRRTRGT